MEKETLQIDSEYLEELIDYVGRSAVGKILKRFEIIQDKDLLKASTKELIYESFRSFRDLLIAHNKGLQIHQFKLKTQTTKEKNSANR
jgi:hypothetical protein